MVLAAGALTQNSVTSTTANLTSAAATGGTPPYTYQWYRATTSGFTPGGGNIIAGATALTLADTGLIPNTQYFYKMVATDAVSATATSTQLAVATSAPVLNPNQFTQSPYVGMIDLRFDGNTVAVLVDVTQATPLFAGAAVKVVDSADGVPKVVGCAANSDEVAGFLNFDIKNVSFNAGDAAEMSMASNVMYLYATGPISRFTQVQLDLSTNGGVAAKVGASGANIVGYAYDKATAAGQLIRVFLACPSFQFA